MRYNIKFSVAKATLHSPMSVRSSVCSVVLTTPQQLEIIILHHPSFILHHSSFILPSFRDFEAFQLVWLVWWIQRSEININSIKQGDSEGWLSNPRYIVRHGGWPGVTEAKYHQVMMMWAEIGWIFPWFGQSMAQTVKRISNRLNYTQNSREAILSSK